MEDGKRTDRNLGWAGVLSTHHSKNGPKTPDGEGWRTIHEIMDESPYGAVKTRKILREKLDSGEAESFNGCEVKEGTSVRRVWYRPKELPISRCNTKM